MPPLGACCRKAKRYPGFVGSARPPVKEVAWMEDDRSRGFSARDQIIP
jgi:hypothetical protein